jgi:glutaredoxin
MLGTVVLVGAFFHAAPQIRESAQKFAMLSQPGAMKQMPAKDLTAQIQEKRESLEKLEAQFAQDGAALAKRYDALTARRKALKSDDADALATFNAEAATYQAQNASRKLAKQEIDSARAELESLLDQRARGAVPAAPGGAKRVVMYTTATCPACVAAKSYMARKGIPFEEHDVNRSPEARAEFQRLGGRGVPLILVGSEKMEGFSPQRLEQLL